ncbi:MAG TPA: undecaprenyldiphospho-muramoylpentapeptide beta-N-acetylglucosaminyltransferase [Burkholderiales bacterium]|jgi:UDP-N-acetylglucosamine--N-acetylmuramyl-(pentapeptide) pyrophosphoryl-undecaprenol N-acetylglucosamine transferase|nr:undecaprenyldiphospho-muramoylpentapeptide beta-N-acetylglucosaminyltransferase [Burkholderiales bacterium]
MSRTILITAGGTGGHVFPGLAVAEAMRAAGWRVVWLGARTGMEARLVPAQGYEMAWVRAAALRGKGVLAALLLPLNLLVGFWQSARAILAHRPDVVLGLGGYVAFPGGMMASLLARPLAVHEQNAIAGLTNRILAGVADRVMVAFPGTLKNAEWTGNPVRAEIARIPAPEERFASRQGPLRLLIVGGSLGAQALNDAVPQALAQMPAHERPQVVHQSGEQHLDALRASYSAASVDGELVAFIDDMARRYAEADLVICRAGAITVAELCTGGMASVLVPFPHAVDDHQSANAAFLADRGAAVLLPQRQLAPGTLAALLRRMDRATLLEMARKARALGKPEAARTVAERCMELAR